MMCYRIALFVFTLFSAFSLTAQRSDWFNVGDIYTYNVIGRSLSNPNRLVVVDEVEIAGQTAMMMVQDTSEEFAPIAMNLTSSVAADTFYVYERNDSVFYYGDGSFHLLYDFNVSLGDTISRYAPLNCQAFTPAGGVESDSIWYVVDSIGSLVIGQDTLRGYHVVAPFVENNPNVTEAAGGLSSGWNYELIGNEANYFFPYNYFLCDGLCPFRLHCFSQPGSLEAPVEFIRPGVDCENFMVSTRDRPLSSEVKVAPNPVLPGGTVSLYLSGNPEFPAATSVTIELYNLNGQKVFSQPAAGFQADGFRVPADLAPGIYFLYLRASGAAAVTRLVVSSSK